MLLAALVLAPFLNTPFTIDDPIFLIQARHALEEPLHPQAVDIVWTGDVWMRASHLFPGGVAVPFLLVPAVLSEHPEFVGHLTQLLFLLLALYVTALIALRLGLGQRGATVTVLLTAATPAVLGMAGTVMPDIATMAYTVLAIERLLAWREDRRWHQAVAVTLWIALAILTRVHMLLLLGAACAFLLDGIRRDEIRTSFSRLGLRYLPLILVPAVCLLAVAVTADPIPPTGVNVDQSAHNLHGLMMNCCAFLSHWVLVVPFGVPWILLRSRKMSVKLTVTAALIAALIATRAGWIAFVAGAGALVLADVALTAIRNRDRDQLALFLWLLPAIAPAFYVHLPCKYVVPLVPAAAILLSRQLAAATTARRFLLPAAVGGGIVLSLLILTGTRSLALTQKRAVDELIVPRVRAGQHVLFAGHWGFHWYAEAAGAEPATWLDPTPQPGDVVVVSFIELPMFATKWTRYSVVERWSENSPGGRVIDHEEGAGFFSNPFGNLPWVWSKKDNNKFEVWRIE
jgi:hypothetical protein